MKKYVFDLDNTLIYTDKLNNDSYNYALKCQGLTPINNFKRITRETVFEQYKNINDTKKDQLIRLKNEYFINNLHLTNINELLINILKFQNKNNCILWTSANEHRAIAILEYYNINNFFKEILFTNKTDVLHDVEKICNLHRCNLNQLVFYEDNLTLIKELRRLNLNVIQV